MPGGPNVPCSDLDEARGISRRLRGGGAAVAPEVLPFGLGLPGSREPVAPRPATEVHGVPATLWETDNLGSRFWNELLQECMTHGRDEGPIAAFAVDAQGLCIAQVGDLDPDAVEATGSRLVVALEQAGRMESFAGSRVAALLVQFDDRWLTGLLLRSGSGGRVVLGVVAREPLPQDARELVAHLVGEALLRC